MRFLEGGVEISNVELLGVDVSEQHSVESEHFAVTQQFVERESHSHSRDLTVDRGGSLLDQLASSGWWRLLVLGLNWSLWLKLVLFLVLLLEFLSFVIWNALEGEREEENESEKDERETGSKHAVVADFVEVVAKEESKANAYSDAVHDEDIHDFEMREEVFGRKSVDHGLVEETSETSNDSTDECN